MTTRPIPALSACALAACLVLLTACGDDTPTDGPTPERHVALEGDPNFRDLGGYRGADGKRVRWDQVFRSGTLQELTDADVTELGRRGLRSVVCFLTQEELDKFGPDRLPADTTFIHQPIVGERVGEISLQAHEALRTADFASLPPDLNKEIHSLLLDDGVKEYATLLRTAMDPTKRPLVFHCSHGVHRTGTAAALLLSALGVPWEVVRADYLLSNTYRGKQNAKYLEALRAKAAKAQGVEASEVDMTNAEAFLVLQGEYIDGTLERAIETHGSVEAFIRDGLGITDEEIARLRKELLE